GGIPRLLDDRGKAMAVDLKMGRVEFTAAGRMLVLPQEGGKVIVLHLTQAPEGSRWWLQRQGGRWQALAALPVLRPTGKTTMHLHVWSPYRDEPALIKELATIK